MNNSSDGNKYNKKSIAILGAATGLLNGLFGSGGGAVAVFGMQRYAGVQTHKSHATAIAVILPLSLVSIFVYARNGIPDLLTLFFVSIGGVLGGYIGAKLLKKLKSQTLHRVFGVFMIAAAIKMIF